MNKNITNKELEERLENIQNIYLTIGNVLKESFAMLPDFPQKDTIQNAVIDKILEDEKIKRLFDSIHNHRPPKFMLVGHTGVGKSSLINALCETYTAVVSDDRSETQETQSYNCMREGETILELLDTRGTAESLTGNGQSAEDNLVHSMKKFDPDIILFLNSAERRDDSINRDARELKKLCERYKKDTDVDIPVIVVLNKVDNIAPPESNPNEYSDTKKENINKAVERYADVFKKEGLIYKSIVPVSSYVEWTESNEKMAELDEKTRLNASMKKDYRYNINKLREVIEENLPSDAAAGFILSKKLTKAIKTLAKRFVHAFSEVSSVVALMPIPIADLPILFSLQTIMVVTIAALSGEKLSVKAAQKFLLNASGMGLLGFLARYTAQQLTKLLNEAVPGTGSAASAAVAFAGTEIMGNAAIANYIDFEKMGNIKKEVKYQGDELKQKNYK